MRDKSSGRLFRFWLTRGLISMDDAALPGSQTAACLPTIIGWRIFSVPFFLWPQARVSKIVTSHICLLYDQRKKTKTCTYTPKKIIIIIVFHKYLVIYALL